MDIKNTKGNSIDFSILKGKSILFFMPDHNNIYKVFSSNIKMLGMDLIHIPPSPHFFYKSKKDRIVNFFRKTFFKDKNYKKKLIRKFNVEYFIEKIRGIEERSIDYIFIIRPDIIEGEILDRLLCLGKKSIAYQWDGLNRFPKVFNTITKFDKFYVFDIEDYQKYHSDYPNLQLTHNFFFEEPLDITEKVQQVKKNDVFYLGSYIEDRMGDLLYIVEKLEQLDLSIDIRLAYWKKINFANKHIVSFKHTIDFLEYLNLVKNSKILLDFKVKEHNGLSLRFFESLKYQKKIITNNRSVMEYDFYNPKNIFILHQDNIADLKDFVLSDYDLLPMDLVERYSFKTWLYNCLFL